MQIKDQWITGFVDGDGCFKVITCPKGYKRYCFVVSQDVRSVDVLYALKKRFNCGSVNKAGQNMREYRVTNQQHLKDIILPFFLKNPLQTNKFLDFKILYEDLNKTSLNHTQKLPLNAEWFAGFVDAEGSFYVSMVNNYPRPQFSIGLHLRDSEILEKIAHFVNCGSVYKKKQKTKTNEEKHYIVFQSASLKDNKYILETLMTNTNSSLLKTTKRISFLKFKSILRIIEKQQHQTPEGIQKIKKIIASKKV